MDRRIFLQSAAKTAAVAATTRLNPLFAQASPPAARSANDVIHLALIGAGIQGQGDTKSRCRCRA